MKKRLKNILIENDIIIKQYCSEEESAQLNELITHGKALPKEVQSQGEGAERVYFRLTTPDLDSDATNVMLKVIAVEKLTKIEKATKINMYIMGGIGFLVTLFLLIITVVISNL